MDTQKADDKYGQLTFLIDGEWLTNHCRSLWADEVEPEKALNTLRAAFAPEMTESQMLEILTGSKKLIGDSKEGIDLVDDNTTTSSCGNLLQIDNVFSRLRDTEAREWGEDLIQLLQGDTVKMASPLGLVEVPRRRTDSTNRLSGPVYFLKDDISLEDIPYRVCNSLTENKVKERTPGIYKDFIQETASGEEESQSYSVHKGHYEITSDTGWLSPEGKFFPCRYMEHIAVANSLGSGEHFLEKLGWVKLNGSGQPMLEPDRPPTQAQIDLIFDYCTKSGAKLPLWLGLSESD